MYVYSYQQYHIMQLVDSAWCFILRAIRHYFPTILANYLYQLLISCNLFIWIFCMPNHAPHIRSNHAMAWESHVCLREEHCEGLWNQRKMTQLPTTQKPPLGHTGKAALRVTLYLCNILQNNKDNLSLLKGKHSCYLKITICSSMRLRPLFCIQTIEPN